MENAQHIARLLPEQRAKSPIAPRRHIQPPQDARRDAGCSAQDHLAVRTRRLTAFLLLSGSSSYAIACSIHHRTAGSPLRT
jgi:hypothetical protein